MSTLYNLRHDGDQYRITKWIDGNPEASYLCDLGACECPAGVRPTCRHRQMLPMMLHADICNSPYFWDYEQEHACDINGAMKPATEDLMFEDEQDERWVSEHALMPTPSRSWRRI